MKVAIFLVDGFEEIEAITPIDLLRRANIEIDIIGVNELQVEGSHGIKMTTDKKMDEINFKEYDVLILPGGPGVTKLKESSVLLDNIKVHNSENKIIAAICAAPSILGEMGILNGKNVTSFPSVRDSLLGANVLDDKVVVDGNIITSRGAGTAYDFSLKIIEVLKNKEESKEIANQTQY